MVFPFNAQPAIPERRELFQTDDGAEALRPFLTIKPPEDANDAPPILAFERPRDVPIPWSEILRTVAVDGVGSAAAIRRYFEESWDLEDRVEERLKHVPEALTAGDSPLVFEISGGEGGPTPAVFRTVFSSDGAPSPEQLSKGVVLRHGTTGRLYRVIPKEPLLKDHFVKDLYEKAWEKVAGVELVFASAEDAANGFSDFEELDMRPAIIERKYQELEILRSYARSVKTKVKEASEAMIDSIVTAGMNTQEIEDLRKRVLRLEIEEFDVERQRQRLASRAAGLGFRLPLQDESIDKPGGGAVPLKAGKIYRPFRNIARWTVAHYVTEIDWGLAAGLSIIIGPLALLAATKRRRIETGHSARYIDYSAVDTSQDLLSAKREELAGQGFEPAVFHRSPQGFRSIDGEPLEALMERCKIDEAFRRRCAVMLPVYEESLTGDSLVAKYSIFKRPLPGLQPSLLPRLGLVESLSYKTAWRETQLGELVSSINLAPGEERQVTISKRFEQVTTETRSSTSIFDVTSSDATDLASEMEDVARRESESSSNFEFGAFASGSFLGVTAEASASGGSSSSLSDMSESIRKVAQKATRSMNQQNRQEVSSSSSAQITVDNRDETVASIRNINQGRSLNLMFYRLYNKYTGGLYLDGLRFEVIPGTEVIAGSGVYQAKSYSLAQLPAVIAQFGPRMLPFSINSEQSKACHGRIGDAIEKLLRDEYANRGDTMSARGAEFAAEPSRSVERVAFPRRGLMKAGAGDANDGDGLEQLAEDLRLLTIDSDEPIAPQDLLVASAGLYLDSTVGVRAATEPYSEEMRAQEIRMRAAEVFATESEGLYKRAMAVRLAGIDREANRLTGLLPDAAHGVLTVAFQSPLPEGDWRLLRDGAEQAALELSDNRLTASFRWAEPQTWLADNRLISRISVLNQETGQILSF